MFSLFICVWAPNLIPYFGYCKFCCNKHECISIFPVYWLWSLGFIPRSGITGSYGGCNLVF
jgi:hypothetical protein